jgi:hypothetical protein
VRDPLAQGALAPLAARDRVVLGDSGGELVHGVVALGA